MNRKLKYFFIKHPSLENKIYYIYNYFKDKTSIEHSVNGKRKDCNYYVIRPRTNCVEGLLSLVIFVLRKIEFAKRKNLLPVVDMKNFRTQYYDGVNNIWDLFFEQPSSISLDNAYNGPYIISGNKFIDREDYKLFSDEIFEKKEVFKKTCELVSNNIVFKKSVTDIINDFDKNYDIRDCIGVYLRGTDYIKLKPVGENIQPNIGDVMKQTDHMILKHGKHKIFLVTEDYNIFCLFKEKYSDDLLTYGDEFLVKNYKGKDFLSKEDVLSTDKIQLALCYLVKMVLLSKCKYLVSSITYGSRFSYILNNNKYEDEYIFNLGIYK